MSFDSIAENQRTSEKVHADCPAGGTISQDHLAVNPVGYGPHIRVLRGNLSFIENRIMENTLFGAL
jgi:hypothetical protein